MAVLQPARKPTMYFVGVTTGQSSIMKVFPAWAEHLGISAELTGIDLPLDDTREHYRQVVRFIKDDPQSLGGLVTTHKLNLFKAARDLFDACSPESELLEEASSISKRDGRLWAKAMDPLTSGLSLQALTGERYWDDGGHLLLLGAGGSSLALTLHLHTEQRAGRPVPAKVVVTNRRPHRLEEMRAIHDRIGFSLDIDYVQAPDPADNDKQVALLPPHSVIANATGLGKDRPGSPLTDDVSFPHDATVWDFNYRGDLVFLDQARAQAAARGLRVEDGWLYFIHGWTRVVADVFDLDIPTSGDRFDELARIAHTVTQKG